MPRLLSEENKRNRVVDSEAILALFRCNPDEFLRRYIIVDQTWIYHYTPETNESSKQASKEVIAQTDAYFEDLPTSYFLDSSKKLEKCIELQGNYVEKYKKIYAN